VLRLIVTVDAGFIGSQYVRSLLKPESVKDLTQITVMESLTYAGKLESLAPVETEPRYTFVKGDINNAALVKASMQEANAVLLTLLRRITLKH